MAGKAKKMEASSSTGYEEKVEEVERILAKLEAGGTSLEESMALFEAGSRLLAECREILSVSERRMEVLLVDQGEIAAMEDMVDWDGQPEDDGGTE